MNEGNEQNRLAVVAIIVEAAAAAPRVNEVLHGMRDHIAGRMGLPYRERGISVISVVMDAPAAAINALSGRLGMIDGVHAKVLFSNR
ncbi:MAG: iron-only hydrogenase system regulator [Clostridiales bacterium]|jgi:putative iron-only hydrogenase system regulator|nr:iron-only hydrogenase system regulator [Clostridiales bacterium]